MSVEAASVNRAERVTLTEEAGAQPSVLLAAISTAALGMFLVARTSLGTATVPA
jgi:hypothetical protein